jgi:UDP-glucose 4-epimerase
VKAVVTGASGFVGSHLTERLLGQGHSVLALDRVRGGNLDEASHSPGFRFMGGDIRDAHYLAEAITDETDMVFHLAAVVGVANYLDNPLAVVDVNVIGTRNVLMAALETGTKVVLASTSEIYGKNPRIPWAEDDDRVLGATSVERWSYSTSHAAAEHLAFSVHRQMGLPLTSVRYFNAYGPRQTPIFVVSRAIHRALNGLKPLVYDGGRQTRCFTYINDIVEGTLAASSTKRAEGEVFNIGNSTETTIAEVTRIVLDQIGAPPAWADFSTSEQYGDAYQDIMRRVPDTSKATRLLNWRAQIDLEEGIRRTIAWARDHPDWLVSEAETTASAPASTESKE